MSISLLSSVSSAKEFTLKIPPQVLHFEFYLKFIQLIQKILRADISLTKIGR